MSTGYSFFSLDDASLNTPFSIRYVRWLYGHSVQDIARYFGVGGSSWYAWERGDVIPREHIWRRILGTTHSDLLTGQCQTRSILQFLEVDERVISEYEITDKEITFVHQVEEFGTALTLWTLRTILGTMRMLNNEGTG